MTSLAWAVKSDLVKEVRKRLDRTSDQDLERQIEELCIFKHVNTLRVAAADVNGALSLMRTSDHLTEIYVKTSRKSGKILSMLSKR